MGRIKNKGDYIQFDPKAYILVKQKIAPNFLRSFGEGRGKTHPLDENASLGDEGDALPTG